MNLVMNIKSADELISERLLGALDAWTRTAAGRMAPKREEITPALLRGILPWIWMADVVDDGADFRFRLAGDRVIQFMGRRYSGSLISQHLESVYFRRMRALFAECTARKKAVAAGPQRSKMKGKEFLEMEVLAMPLSDDGESVTGLFGAMDTRAIGGHPGAG